MISDCAYRITVHQLGHTSDLMLKVTEKALFQRDLRLENGLILGLRGPTGIAYVGLRHDDKCSVEDNQMEWEEGGCCSDLNYSRVPETVRVRMNGLMTSS